MSAEKTFLKSPKKINPLAHTRTFSFFDVRLNLNNFILFVCYAQNTVRILKKVSFMFTHPLLKSIRYYLFVTQ